MNTTLLEEERLTFNLKNSAALHGGAFMKTQVKVKGETRQMVEY